MNGSEVKLLQCRKKNTYTNTYLGSLATLYVLKKQKMETHFLKFVFVRLLIRNKLRITKKIDV